MEKTLSNELFVVGVSLDCLSVGCSPDSPIANRLQALSGQVLSDSKKIADLEDKVKHIDYIREQLFDYFERTFTIDRDEEFLEAQLGSMTWKFIKGD